MRIGVPVVVLVCSLGSTASRAGDPAEPQLDAASLARDVLGPSDPTYANLRAKLAQLPVADSLRVLDEVRRVGRDPFERFSLDLVTKEAGGDDAARAVILERALKSPKPWTVRVEAYVVRLPSRAVSSVLEGHRPTREGSVVSVPEEVATRLLRAEEHGGAVAPLQPIDLFDGQEGLVHTGAMSTYLQDYDVEQLRTVHLKPLVGTIQEGAALRLTPHRSVEPGAVSIDAQLQVGLLNRPIGTFATKCEGAPTEVVIQLPELRMVSTKGRSTGTLGGWFLAGNDFPIDNGSLVLALIHVLDATPR